MKIGFLGYLENSIELSNFLERAKDEVFKTQQTHVYICTYDKSSNNLLFGGHTNKLKKIISDHILNNQDYYIVKSPEELILQSSLKSSKIFFLLCPWQQKETIYYKMKSKLRQNKLLKVA